MQSKIWSFNPTLFRKNLTRFWPLWGLASFIGALFPLALMTGLLRGGGPESAAEFTQLYYAVVSYAVPVISLIYAVLCAMAVWSYLYSPRSVGLLHTLPIRREGLFLTNFAAGLTMTLLPYAVTGALSVVVSLAFGRFDAVGLGVTVLAVAGESFFYFASATFVAFITGNVFALPALYFLLHFLAVILEFLLSALARSFLFGYDGYGGAAQWLSPTVYLQNQLGHLDHFTEVERVSSSGERYLVDVLAAVEPENFHLIALYALAGVVLTALALALYRRRRSETAGDVVAVGALRPVFRYGVAALTALAGGQLLYELFWYPFQAGRYGDPLPMLACLLVAGAIGYYGASMLLAKSLRVFRGSWKGLLAVALGCCAVCGVLRFDLLGITARVPALSEVSAVSFRAADNSYTLYAGQDDALIEELRTVHQAVIGDEDYIRGMENGGSTYDVADPWAVTEAWDSLSVIYTLKSGGSVERWYSLPLTRERLETAGTYDHLLDQLVNSDALKRKRLHLDDPSYQVNSGSLYVDRQNQSYDLGSREAEAILAAVGRDLERGNWGQYDWFRWTDSGDYAMDLSLSFTILADGREEGRDWIDLNLTPAMTETAQCLLDLGLVAPEDLVTQKELYPDRYADEDVDVIDGVPYYPAASEDAAVLVNPA